MSIPLKTIKPIKDEAPPPYGNGTAPMSNEWSPSSPPVYDQPDVLSANKTTDDVITFDESDLGHTNLAFTNVSYHEITMQTVKFVN